MDKNNKDQKRLVFADYFTSFMTREISDDSKVWRYYNGDKVQYSGDLYEMPGSNKKDTSTPNYPLIGTYDTLDTIVLEYHILLAKLAGIDGFFCEYSLASGHDGKVPVLMAKLGKLYEFKVGIHWITINFTSWTEGVENREQLLEKAKETLRKCIDEIYNVSGIKIDNKPVVLFFVLHTNEYDNSEVKSTYFTPKELKEIRKSIDRKNPIFFASTFKDNFHKNFTGAINGFFPWVIPSGSPIPEGGLFDQISDLSLQEMHLTDFYSLALQKKNQERFPYFMGGAWPGFDDRKGRAWGEDIARYVPREDGRTLQRTWELAETSGTQVILIATWNDWVESTSLEPSIELGYSNLEICQEKIAAWKGIDLSTEDLRLPERILSLRRKIILYKNIGFSKNTLKKMNNKIDKAAIYLSRLETKKSLRMIINLEKQITERFENKVQEQDMEIIWPDNKSPSIEWISREGFDLSMIEEKIPLSFYTLRFGVSKDINEKIGYNYCAGRISFTYEDNAANWLVVTQGNDYLIPVGKEIASFRKQGKGGWKTAEMDILQGILPGKGFKNVWFCIQSQGSLSLESLKEIKLILKIYRIEN